MLLSFPWLAAHYLGMILFTTLEANRVDHVINRIHRLPTLSTLVHLVILSVLCPSISTQCLCADGWAQSPSLILFHPIVWSTPIEGLTSVDGVKENRLD